MDFETQPTPGIDILKKRDKIRSAWISFVGRITAQLIGAIATVGLGVVVLNGHFSTGSHAAATAGAGPSSSPSVLIATPVRTERETVIVVMPIDSKMSFNQSEIDRVARAVVSDFSDAQSTGQAVIRRHTIE